MLSNQLKVALRGLRRDRSFTALNLAGLATGLAVFVALLLIVAQDFGFDRHWDGADRLRRVTTHRVLPTSTVTSAATPRPLGPSLQGALPGVESLTRVSAERAQRVVLEAAGQTMADEHIRFADAAVFDVFGLDLTDGVAHAALATPFSIVLTESMARRLFGRVSPVGQTVSLRLLGDGDSFAYTISGVMPDLPQKSHLSVSAVATYAGHPLVGDADDQDNWLGLDLYTYVRLSDPDLGAVVEQRINAIAQPVVRERLEATFGEEATAGDGMTFALQPVRAIHTASGLSNELSPGAPMNQLLLILCIAGFVLLLACINFASLATARSLRRLREIGVRRVLGSTRSQLIRGFLAEAFVMVLGGMVLSLVLLESAAPYVARLAGQPIVLPFDAPWFVPTLAAVAVLAALAAGSYPAFLLSRPTPVRRLLREQTSTRSVAGVRSVLVALQFGVSAVILVGTFSVVRQLSFLQDRELGFQPAQVLVVEGAEGVRPRLGALKQALRSQTGIAAVGSGQAAPGGLPGTTIVRRQGADASEERELRWLTVAEGYVESMGISVLDGRAFRDDSAEDSMSVLLNEAAVRALGLRNPVGQSLESEGRTYTVLGVMADYHYRPLTELLEPLVLFGPDPFNRNRSSQVVTVRAQGSPAEGLQQVREAWRATIPEQSFSGYALADRMASLYPGAERLRALGSLGSLFSLFIAGIGLLGLTSYSAERRRKEIGVRRVLGASFGDIIRLLARDFTGPILVSMAIAGPLGWIAARHWLNSFAYRVEVGIPVVLAAAGFCLAVAAAAMVSQSIRASRWEPASQLRDD